MKRLLERRAAATIEVQPAPLLLPRRWPERVFGWLLAAVGVQVVLGITAVWLDLHRADASENGVFIHMFDVNRESNVPTWFSSVELLLCAGALIAIAMLSRSRGRPYVRHWLLLAWVLAFLSMDEVAMVHDTLSGMISARVETGGVLRYIWVVPYGVGVAVLGAVYLRFFLWLPARSRWLFALAAGLYVGGALGIEMVSGYWESYHGGGAISLSMTICEETGEMLGSATFVYALCDYLRSEFATGG